MIDPKSADIAEVVILEHREDRNVAVVEFDVGDGDKVRLVTKPADLRVLAVRLYASARKILDGTKINAGLN